QVEDLTRVEARRCRLIQRSAASAAGLRKMVDGGVGVFGSAQRLTGMALLSARLFAGRFAQASRARGFLVQSVAGRRFAAVAAVQAKAAFQFSDAGSERRDDLPLRAVLFQQCRDDLAKRRRLAGRCAIIGVGMRIGRWKRHRELDSCPESRVKRRSAARYLGCYDIRWRHSRIHRFFRSNVSLTLRRGLPRAASVDCVSMHEQAWKHSQTMMSSWRIGDAVGEHYSSFTKAWRTR